MSYKGKAHKNALLPTSHVQDMRHDRRPRRPTSTQKFTRFFTRTIPRTTNTAVRYTNRKILPVVGDIAKVVVPTALGFGLYKMGYSPIITDTAHTVASMVMPPMRTRRGQFNKPSYYYEHVAPGGYYRRPETMYGSGPLDYEFMTSDDIVRAHRPPSQVTRPGSSLPHGSLPPGTPPASEREVIPPPQYAQQSDMELIDLGADDPDYQAAVQRSVELDRAHAALRRQIQRANDVINRANR